MTPDRELTLLEEWDRLESSRNEGRRLRGEALARLGHELGAVRDALAETLESHRRAEEQEALAEQDCGQTLRDALLASRAELEKLREQASGQAEQLSKARERERELLDKIEGDRVSQSLADEAIASLERNLNRTRTELKHASDELVSERLELRKARAECAALSDESARALETTTETCLENATLKKQVEELRVALAHQQAETSRLTQAHDEAVDQLLSLRREHESAVESLEGEHARALESLRFDHEGELHALQERLDKASSDFEEAIRVRDVSAARLIELQTQLDAAKRNLSWQQAELEEERSGQQQELDLLRGRLAEEREAHVAKALEAKSLLDQARARALSAEDEAAQLRRQNAAEVQELLERFEAVEAHLRSLLESNRLQEQELDEKRMAYEATRAELESAQEKLRYAEERMKEMALALDLVRTSHELPAGEKSGEEARRVAEPMTRSSAPPRKSVKRRSLPPRPDLSPGGYSMTEIEIREEVVTDPAASPRRRRKP